MNDSSEKPRFRITVKSIAGILLQLILFAAIVSVIGYRGFTDALLDQYADGAFRTALTAAKEVDPDRIDEYAQGGWQDPEYLSVFSKLDSLCNTSGATFVYVILPDTSDYAHITFIFSTKNRANDYTVYDFGYVRETTNDDYRQKYRALYEEGSEKELVVRDKGYIETDPHITAMIPLRGTDGETKAILCVQRQMDALSSARRSYIRKVVIAMLVLAAAVTAGQALYLNRVLLKPVKQITEEASRFAEENVAAEVKLLDSIRTNDEIAVLAGSIDRMEEQVIDYVENLRQATAEKERIGTELSLAARIQASMLPSGFPLFPGRDEFDAFAYMDPAREVGGDFYDLFLIDDDRLCIVMADVSGKGVPAALFMMASKIHISGAAKTGKTPAEVLASVNEAICASNPEQMFVTVWLGILEISTGRLTAANAGHEYPALMRAGGEFGLIRDKHGFVIGGIGGVRYTDYEIMLEKGDAVFLYTDGVPEASDANGNMFGTEGMLEALNADPGIAPAELISAVSTAVGDFVGGAEQFDDIPMLCVRYAGAERRN